MDNINDSLYPLTVMVALFTCLLESKHNNLSKRLHFESNWNIDEEYRFQFKYEFNKKISNVINHDSDFDIGAGLELKF